MIQQRFDYYRYAPEATRALAAASRAAAGGTLEPGLTHLVSLRASQMNGCSYCVDLHFRDAQRTGRSARALNAVVAWREAPFFSERERAALAWTEALTRLPPDGVSDDLWRHVRTYFEEHEIAMLTFAVAIINAWNRLSVSARKGPELDD